MAEAPTDLKQTPLYERHQALGAKLVPFAGYALPVQYPSGILKEHAHTRSAAGLFDVSHMGQIVIRGDDPIAAIETLVPGDVQALDIGAMRYSQLTNEAGGIRDDLIITRFEDHLFMVVNGACKEADLAHMQAGLAGRADVEMLADRALLALQGPAAAAMLARHSSTDLSAMAFMTAARVAVAGVDCLVSRSGYTGEDGFEISVAASNALAVCDALLAETEVAPIGLGARDSLRLEAGLCLYGHDIDESTTPGEAGLLWSISKRRRAEGGFPGAAVVQRQIADGVARRRVGIRVQGRAPVREGAEIRDPESGRAIGRITSGGFAPTLGAPVAMGYVETAFAKINTGLALDLRGKAVPALVAAMPFVPQRYYRG